MKQLTSLCVLIFCSLPLAAQRYPADAADVFRKYINMRDYSDKGFLLRRIDSYDLEEGGLRMLQMHVKKTFVAQDGTMHIDTLFFNKKEIKHIKHSLKVMRSFSWTKEMKDKYGLEKLILVDSVPDYKSVPVPLTHMLAMPVFLRNNKLCILLSNTYCSASLCGDAGPVQIIAYKKTHDDWELWAVL